ncbi:MAG TPA: hypothetical protein VN903_11895, partial [Polyangia bacterium]|nr:hypothetical protein [Polyangia bacterium]
MAGAAGCHGSISAQGSGQAGGQAGGSITGVAGAGGATATGTAGGGGTVDTVVMDCMASNGILNAG